MNAMIKGAGYTGAVLQIAFGVVHSALGWTVASAELAKARLSAEFINGLALPWYFAGAAMVALGLISIVILRITISPVLRQRLLLLLIIPYAVTGIVVGAMVGFPAGAVVFILPAILLTPAAMSTAVTAPAVSPTL